MPRDFFEKHVRRNYEAWMKGPLEEHLAKNAVSDANNMAARVLHYWKDRDPDQVFGAKSEGDYRQALAGNECEDFGLVRDVADAYKHVELSRNSRRLTRTDQTASEAHVYGGPSYFGGDAHYGGEQLVVTLDDGSKRPLKTIMQNVMEMWERLLSEWNL